MVICRIFCAWLWQLQSNILTTKDILHSQNQSVHVYSSMQTDSPCDYIICYKTICHEIFPTSKWSLSFLPVICGTKWPQHIYTFQLWFKQAARSDRSTVHPKFHQTTVWTHDLWTMDSILHVPEMLILTTEPSGMLSQYSVKFPMPLIS